MWVLGIDLRTSGRAISAAPMTLIFNDENNVIRTVFAFFHNSFESKWQQDGGGLTEEPFHPALGLFPWLLRLSLYV